MHIIILHKLNYLQDFDIRYNFRFFVLFPCVIDHCRDTVPLNLTSGDLFWFLCCPKTGIEMIYVDCRYIEIFTYKIKRLMCLRNIKLADTIKIILGHPGVEEQGSIYTKQCSWKTIYYVSNL